jgi:hypothetical protein
MEIAYVEEFKEFTMVCNGVTFHVSAKNGSAFFNYENPKTQTKINIPISNISEIKNPMYMSSLVCGDEEMYHTFESQKKFLSGNNNMTNDKSVLCTITYCIDSIIVGLGLLRKERLKTKNEELEKILNDSAIYVVLQDFFAEQKVPEADQPIIIETIKNYGERISLHNNAVCYKTNEGKKLFLGGLLNHDPMSEDKITPLDYEASKEL